MKRKIIILLIALLLVPIGLYEFARDGERPLVTSAVDVGKTMGAWNVSSVDERLREIETGAWDAKLARIRPKQEKQVYWAHREKTKTPVSFVYIHGFSAGPLELEPTIQKLAAMSNANLFITRLRAHGLESGAAFRDVRAEEWLADTVEAIAVGHLIGERVVVVGMSTGASLALIATEAVSRYRREMKPHGLILLSPNFRLANRGADVLMREAMAPFTETVMRLVEGDEHEFPLRNEWHRERWTSRYPIEGAVQLMRVLRAVAKLRLDDELLSDIPRLLLYTAKDTVVSVAEIERRLEVSHSDGLTAVNWANGDQHQLASRAFSPEKTDELVNLIDQWVQLQSFSVVGRGN
ncbi:MAG: alpha/beta fold hydrolase [Bdellovibrionaceae bacterium]|nr:alpha/beta fold hydrolase [Pseudobdellovibrionaceae bacterium]